MITKTLGELAQYVGGRVLGDANVKISAAATLGRTQPAPTGQHKKTIANSAFRTIIPAFV